MFLELALGAFKFLLLRLVLEIPLIVSFHSNFSDEFGKCYNLLFCFLDLVYCLMFLERWKRFGLPMQQPYIFNSSNITLSVLKLLQDHPGYSLKYGKWSKLGKKNICLC
jgi:hypothetical protein